MILALPLKFLLSAIFGALIGLERESSRNSDHKGTLGGIRTFALIAIMGAFAGFANAEGMTGIFLIIAVGIFTLIAIYYILSSLSTGGLGLTTEISALYAFLLGFFITAEALSVQMSVALLVVLLLILSAKSQTKKIILGISHQEVQSFISYLIIALVVLPFLPNKAYYLTDIPNISALLDAYSIHLGSWGDIEIFNPHRLWLIVALITGIDIFGYITSRLIGKNSGVVLTSAIAGFISSTATTQSLAMQSNKNKSYRRLLGSAMLANAASFIQIFIIVLAINSQWLVAITPTLVLITISALALALFFLAYRDKKSRFDQIANRHDKKLFSLLPAIKFACILIAVRIITKTSLLLFGQKGFLLTSVIASFSGIDAVTVNLAETAGSVITFKSALLVFVAINATNLISKSIYATIQGHRQFSWRLGASMIIISLAGFLGYLVI
ncbi:MgtC/SapB family protein [Candidatus Microgenomates bacterium]|nr:MgtC/SapB family protein [Candidatus Microgenomates bacterium]